MEIETVYFTTNYKDIPVKAYYVKLKEWYIYSMQKTIIEYVPYINLSLTPRWALKIGNVYHYFSFAGKQPSYYKYDNIDGLKFNFPDIAVIDASQVQPQKVSYKQGLLNTKNIVLLSGLTVLLIGLSIVREYIVKKKQEEIAKQNLLAMQKPQKPQKSVLSSNICMSNRDSFLKHFNYGMIMYNKRMVIRLLNKTYYIPIKDEQVKPVTKMVLYKPFKGHFQFVNGIITIGSYSGCLDFVVKNDIPMQIIRFDTTGCLIKLDINHCIEG